MKRRRTRSTLSIMSASWYRPGMLLSVGGGRGDEFVIVRRVVNTMTLEVVPYAGWRKLAHRARARLRYRWRRITDTVYGWFERDDDDE